MRPYDLVILTSTILVCESNEELNDKLGTKLSSCFMLKANFLSKLIGV